MIFPACSTDGSSYNYFGISWCLLQFSSDNYWCNMMLFLYVISYLNMKYEVSTLIIFMFRLLYLTVYNMQVNYIFWLVWIIYNILHFLSSFLPFLWCALKLPPTLFSYICGPIKKHQREILFISILATHLCFSFSCSWDILSSYSDAFLFSV